MAKENLCIELRDEGQVKFLAMPPGFVACPEPVREFDVQFLRRFASSDNPQVQLSFFYRGQPTDELTGTNFRSVLSAPAHKLSKEELANIEIVLRDAGEPDWFDLASAATELLSGKTVLSIEGTWRKSQLYDWGIFIDVDGSGCIIQEIHYTAPLAVQNLYAAAVKAALATIVWK